MAAALENKDFTCVNHSRLTPQIKQLVKVLGISATYKLLNAFGGQNISIPHCVNKVDHPFALAIGLDDANKFCKSYSHNIMMTIPMLDTLLHNMRLNLVCVDYQKGTSINKLVKKYKFSHRYITVLVSQCDRNAIAIKNHLKTPQLDFFPEFDKEQGYL